MVVIVAPAHVSEILIEVIVANPHHSQVVSSDVSTVVGCDLQREPLQAAITGIEHATIREPDAISGPVNVMPIQVRP